MSLYRQSWRNPGLRRAAALAAGLVITGLAQATPSTYLSLAAFNQATQAAGVDSFDTLPQGVPLPSPQNRAAGNWSYSVAADTDPTLFSAGAVVPPGELVAAGTGADRWLSSNAASDTLRFFGLGNARAIGGFFFGSDVDGAFASGATLELLATDATGSASFTLNNAGTSSFVGFVGVGALTSLTVRSLQPAAGSQWATVNDLRLASAVPEPQTLALVAAALLALASSRRSRAAAWPDRA